MHMLQQYKKQFEELLSRLKIYNNNNKHSKILKLIQDIQKLFTLYTLQYCVGICAKIYVQK